MKAGDRDKRNMTGNDNITGIARLGAGIGTIARSVSTGVQSAGAMVLDRTIRRNQTQQQQTQHAKEHGWQSIPTASWSKEASSKSDMDMGDATCEEWFKS